MPALCWIISDLHSGWNCGPFWKQEPWLMMQRMLNHQEDTPCCWIFLWQINITVWPYPIVVYTARPSHLNPNNLCRIITNKQIFNRIVTFPCEIIFCVQSGYKGQRNNVPSIKQTQMTKPCACLILALIMIELIFKSVFFIKKKCK